MQVPSSGAAAACFVRTRGPGSKPATLRFSCEQGDSAHWPFSAGGCLVCSGKLTAKDSAGQRRTAAPPTCCFHRLTDLHTGRPGCHP